MRILENSNKVIESHEESVPRKHQTHAQREEDPVRQTSVFCSLSDDCDDDYDDYDGF